MNYDKLVNWFIHPSLKDDLERYVRARQLVIFALFSFLFFIANVIKWLNLDYPNLALSMAGVGIVVFLMTLLFRRNGKLTIPGYCMMGALNLHFIYLISLTGGFDSTAITWLIVVPLLSSLYFGNWFSMFWTSFLMIVLLVFYYLKLIEYPLPSITLSEAEIAKSQVANYFGPLLAVFIAGWFFNKGMSRAFKGQKESLALQNETVERLENMFDSIGETGEAILQASTVLDTTAEELSGKSSEMNSLSMNASEETKKTLVNIKNMADSAGKASGSVNSVASASNELSGNLKQIEGATSNVSEHLNTVSDNAEHMCKAVNIIATAIEQMYSSLNEVAKNSTRGASVTSDASEKAETASEIINTLGADAEKIGDVIELIKGIASQTHILALNATIEAVGAGDSGKGFRVVANEVKDLARQTTGATEGIRKKILSMQTNTKAAVKAIEIIVKVISEINLIMENIASAVEEQTATTNEISKSIVGTVSAAESVSDNLFEAARNVATTSERIREAVQFGVDVSGSLDQLAKSAEDIAEDAAIASEQIERVTQSVVGVTESINITSRSAARIKYQAENLTHLVSQIETLIR